MASKKVKTLNKFDQSVSKIKDATFMVNDYAFETTETILTEVVKRGEQWQDLTAKAINESFKLVATQQEMVFDTLENVKIQLKEGTERVKVLIGKN